MRFYNTYINYSSSIFNQTSIMYISNNIYSIYFFFLQPTDINEVIEELGDVFRSYTEFNAQVNICDKSCFHLYTSLF